MTSSSPSAAVSAATVSTGTADPAGNAEQNEHAVAPAGRSRSRAAWLVPGLGLAPFVIYLALFFGLPVALIAFNAFRRKDPASGMTSFSLQNIDDSLHGVYRAALVHSIQLAAVTAFASTILGLLLAYAISSGRSGLLKQLTATSAAVLANFGGLPLAFLFVAVVGGAGVLTKILQSTFGLSLQDDLHFNLFSLTGVEVVYLYFLIPLMVLVITPALEGLRPQWREAAENLGATGWQYWRLVAGPVLLPNLLGSALLLFCSSLSAFATASALTNGTLAITPLQIDTAVSGNVLTGQENLAAALALDMIVIVVPLTLIYQYLQRRGARWLR
ncbi:ABC transporter permease subunit [Jatrophihabitans telluris]|uniref:ABC transporter permease subunit n=1 Tax=Jatrophihabitans telluris TaxID=2038343 RepID=A0ABY4QYU2_9ACTN|nr:ABC transporter permease subunit [Jatrophihabitans telluris]UQX88589.1 ABC transporter permease subunit [Jatrophihabitans telluris]